MKPADRDPIEKTEPRGSDVAGVPQRILFHLAWIGALGLMAGFGVVLLFLY
jgi:hypothetical protein